MDEDTMNVPGQTCGDAGGEPRTAFPAGSRWDSGNRAFVACMTPNVPRRPRLYGPQGVALQVPRDEEPRLRYPRTAPVPPKTLHDAVAWSSWAMRSVATGVIDARTAHEIGYLVNAFKASLEKADLLDELRGQVDALKRLRAS